MNEPRTYSAAAYWRTNISGGLLGGIGAAILLIVVFGTALWMTAFAGNVLAWFGGICIVLIGTAIALYPGNLVAVYPLAVEIEPAKKIVLIAPWKRLAIPIEEIQAVRDSTGWQVLQQGSVVKLNRRHGLIKAFIIHWAFGAEGRQLAHAIRQEISLRVARP